MPSSRKHPDCNTANCHGVCTPRTGALCSKWPTHNIIGPPKHQWYWWGKILEQCPKDMKRQYPPQQELPFILPSVFMQVFRAVECPDRQSRFWPSGETNGAVVIFPRKASSGLGCCLEKFRSLPGVVALMEIVRLKLKWRLNICEMETVRSLWFMKCDWCCLVGCSTNQWNRFQLPRDLTTC